MKTKFIKTQNVVIAKILAILGFGAVITGCEPKYGTLVAEYGVPSAKFIVNGKVSLQHPIENIRVVMHGSYNDTAFTDEHGNYEVAIDNNAWNSNFLVQFHDTENRYKDLDTIVEFKDPKFTGGDGWYEGETRKTVNVELTPKEN
jgi:putative lipoprotein (rSAM/lipoprotein system)